MSKERHSLNDVVYFVARFLHPAIPETDDFFTDPYLWERLIESQLNLMSMCSRSGGPQDSGCLAPLCGTSFSYMSIARYRQLVMYLIRRMTAAMAAKAIDGFERVTGGDLCAN